MATNSNYDATHVVCFPSKLLAQEGGKHIISVKPEADRDQGSICGKGDFIEPDYYKEVASTSFTGKIVALDTARTSLLAEKEFYYIEVTDPGDAWLICSVPNITDGNGTYASMQEERYYNAKGEPARAYELAKHDVFSISKNGIDGTVEVGKEVSVENYRLKAAD